MLLLFGDELAPHVRILLCPSIRSSGQHVVRKYVVVAKGRNDRDHQIIGRIGVIDVVVLSEDFDDFVNHILVQFGDLCFCPRQLLIIVVTSRVASPDDEIDLALQVRIDPSESLIDEGKWRIAIGGFRAVQTRDSRAPVTFCIFFCG